MLTTSQAVRDLRITLTRANDLAIRLDEQIETGGLMSDRSVELAAELDDALLKAEILRRRIMESQPVEGLRPAAESLPRTMHVHGIGDVPIFTAAEIAEGLRKSEAAFCEAIGELVGRPEPATNTPEDRIVPFRARPLNQQDGAL